MEIASQQLAVFQQTIVGTFTQMPVDDYSKLTTISFTLPLSYSKIHRDTVPSDTCIG